MLEFEFILCIANNCHTQQNSKQFLKWKKEEYNIFHILLFSDFHLFFK
jgi:hypothetical protein